MFCQNYKLQGFRSMTIKPCDNKATLMVDARTDGIYKVCAQCANRYFSPKYYRRELSKEED